MERDNVKYTVDHSTEDCEVKEFVNISYENVDETTQEDTPLLDTTTQTDTTQEDTSPVETTTQTDTTQEDTPPVETTTQEDTTQEDTTPDTNQTDTTTEDTTTEDTTSEETTVCGRVSCLATNELGETHIDSEVETDIDDYLNCLYCIC
jgi:hypothetical protein